MHASSAMETRCEQEVDRESLRLSFTGLKVAVIPPAALGDTLVYLRLAWLFHLAGASVRFPANTLYSARENFEWLSVEPYVQKDLPALSDECDLVVAYFNQLPTEGSLREQCLARSNIALVSAKKIPSELCLDSRDVHVGARVYQHAGMPFCLHSKDGRTMVAWVEHYAQRVFGLQSSDLPIPVRCKSVRPASNRVVIFPTSPKPRKNYSPAGFLSLANRLRRKGWRVEFACQGPEQARLSSELSGFEVVSFPDIQALMAYLAGAHAVISNDSGGGHLGSLLGLRTFTITRKHALFAWRPGFNPHNFVVAPLTRIKWGDDYIWRPFVPVGRIVSRLGQAPVEGR
ncbi:glycosyltransferase family 9 protein [Pseudomonas sp. PDM14]|uniref:glycosyltransferase family 9 protein n=1 Tax=Pseudomonas sp. PDM14 TaxID=2769288 RepID=UPI001CE15F0E|nr:glycosyltransferase family 9 protein [Pseudomonas sp. PDM14]